MKNISRIKKEIKDILNIKSDVEVVKISDGFVKHLEKRNHTNMLKYVDNIEDILNFPDYVGVNPREKGTSLEYVKILEDNVLVAVKLDVKNNYFYTATMHEISNLKLEQRIKNGRLKKLTNN